MNHTERINYTARQSRNLTRRLVKEAVEIYLEKLAEEIVEGEWVDLPGIGKIRVSIESGSGAHGLRDHLRLRTRIRLGRRLKKACRKQF